jgi:hypothetical protein
LLDSKMSMTDVPFAGMLDSFPATRPTVENGAVRRMVMQ